MEVIFNDICEIYEEVRKNTKNKKKIYKFEMFKMENLFSIYESLVNNSYIFDKYNIFLIRSPKYRIIMSLNIKDKIVNHLVTRKVLMPKLESYLDIRNVATRKNMGKDYGIKLVNKYIEHFKGSNFYILKLDISKYFYNIDHNVLKGMIKDKLDSDEYKLVCNIIDSTNLEYVNKRIKKIKKIEKNIDIPYYEYGKGLPIGNMSSQFLSIFYLNGLDHKIIHDYKLKYYVRYMDDIIIFSKSKEYLKDIMKKIECVLYNEYKLKLNYKKSKIVSIKEGFCFCGYNFRVINNKTIIKVCSNTKRRVIKRSKEVLWLYKNSKISFMKLFYSFNTYYNGFKYSNLCIRRKLDRLYEK